MLKDRNVEDKTKQMFANALKQMLETKPIAQISITQLCKECHVNRKTFYYHFIDMSDLVFWIFQKEIKEATHDRFSFPNKMEESLYYLIDYMDENRGICKTVFASCYSSQLRASWMIEIKELVEKTVKSIEIKNGKSKQNREVMIDFFTGAIYELVISYATRSCDNKQNISERISYIMHLFMVAMKEE